MDSPDQTKKEFLSKYFLYLPQKDDFFKLKEKVSDTFTENILKLVQKKQILQVENVSYNYHKEAKIFL